MRESIINMPDRFSLDLSTRRSENKTNELIIKNFDFELVTPLFGGDSESWKIDTKSPIRTSSIKGQLRFWWRTMQNETKHIDLLNKENSLWGGEVENRNGEKQAIKSPVSIAVINQKVIKKEFAKPNGKNNGLGDNIISNYVLFPITDQVKKKENITIIKELRFKLVISFPAALEKEVLNTLKCWVLFGGVGARTRRGTGSLYCPALLDGFSSEKDIKRFVGGFNNCPGDKLDYPRMAGSSLFMQKIKTKKTPAEACKTLLDEYGKYRQKRPPGKPPGRSYWPEPDAIRRLYGTNSAKHVPVHPDGNWFPRAAFGLPILTKFITPGDPDNGKDITLQPKGDARLPSPVVIKVIRLKNCIFKCCLVVNQKFPDKLELQGQGARCFDISSSEMPFYSEPPKDKIMVKDSCLKQDQTIYQHLAEYLGLEEVK